jgi:hypothetical protein
MGDGQPQMRDARLEVVVEAGDRGRQRGGVIGADGRLCVPKTSSVLIG